MREYVHDMTDKIARAAEERMRHSELLLLVEDRISREQTSALPAESVYPYLAISREAAAGGGEVARLAAERLGWRHLNHELLECVAQISHVTPELLETLDEKDSSWIAQMFGHLFDAYSISQIEFVNRMTDVLLIAARQASMVVVGRGAQFVLPRERGLAVRIVAPLRQRIGHVEREKQMSRAAAARYIAQTDNERRAFIERYFHHDVNDPHHFDWVLNMEHLSADEAAEMLVQLCREHFPDAILKPGPI